MTPDPTPLSGFDAVAHRYDSDEESNPAFAHMRERSYRRLAESFTPRARLLEIGSGTGTEAARLAARGAALVLVDVSSHLLALAEAKVRAAREAAFIGAHLIPARRLHELTQIYGRASFDGAYSSLGALNCEPDLGPVAAGAASLVRPGGMLVVSVMNRRCAVEALWFALHADWTSVRRRGRGPILASTYPGGPRDVSTTYYGRAEIERAFGATFTTEFVEALPLFWPPTTLDFLVRRYPRWYAALDPIERRMGRWPLLRGLGDHVLLGLRRRRA